MILGVALLATGCAKEEPKPTPTPTKTAIFSSEEAALQAAIDTYQQYAAAVDRITADGDEHLPSIKDLVTEEYYDSYAQETTFEDRGWHTSGSSTFRNAELVDLSQTSDEATVQIALCRDLSDVKILDEESMDISSEVRQSTVFPYTLRFVWDSETSTLRLDDSGSWDDDSIC